MLVNTPHTLFITDITDLFFDFRLPQMRVEYFRSVSLDMVDLSKDSMFNMNKFRYTQCTQKRLKFTWKRRHDN